MNNHHKSVRYREMAAEAQHALVTIQKHIGIVQDKINILGTFEERQRKHYASLRAAYNACSSISDSELKTRMEERTKQAAKNNARMKEMKRARRSPDKKKAAVGNSRKQGLV
jgi:hypothetical protein